MEPPTATGHLSGDGGSSEGMQHNVKNCGISLVEGISV
jgi:hypothetical protein